MSDTHKKNSEIVVLHLPNNHSLVRHKPWLLAALIALMAVVILTGLLFMPSNNFLANYQKVTATEAAIAQANPALSAEVDVLKAQVVGLVSGSIESKLRTLEASVRSGTLTNSLGTIDDLKNDLKLLRSYSEPAKNQPDAAAVNAQLMQEMAQLKRLIYLTIGSCALMLSVIAGVWIKNKRLPYKEVLRKLKAMV
jgi:cell division protein FtsB